jgi:hypothetical protein
MAAVKSVLWKIVQFPLFRIVIATAWLMAVAFAMRVSLRLLGRINIPILFVSVGITLIVTCLSYYAFVRIFEKRHPDELS